MLKVARATKKTINIFEFKTIPPHILYLIFAMYILHNMVYIKYSTVMKCKQRKIIILKYILKNNAEIDKEFI